jgi:predicted site-specific integrase-resolvase
MKSKEVLKLMKITRPTLCAYIKSGKIKGIKQSNGYYDYDEKSIYAFMKIPMDARINVIYARVSTQKQKKDLCTQVSSLTNFCIENDIEYSNIYQEIASGIDFERKQFSSLMQLVFEHKVNNIYITYKDRISRLSFLTLKNMFKQFGTNIIIINKNNNTNSDELFEELLSLIHLFSTKTYSQRRKTIFGKCSKLLKTT